MSLYEFKFMKFKSMLNLSMVLEVKIEFALVGQWVEVAPRKPRVGSAKSIQSCPTLCDPIDGSPPDSPVPGILQARTENSQSQTAIMFAPT